MGSALLYEVRNSRQEKVSSDVLEVRRGGRRDGASALAVLEAQRAWGRHVCTTCSCARRQGMWQGEGASTFH